MHRTARTMVKTSGGIPPWIGAAAAAGGLSLGGYVVLTAMRPTGCIGDRECAVRPMREGGPESILLLVGVLLVLVSCAGLAHRARQTNGRTSWWKGAAALVASGVVLLLTGWAANLVSQDLPPFLVGPGVLVLAVGTLLVGILGVRSAALPRHSTGLLIVAALALPGYNEQNWRVLLLFPFATAWVMVGRAASAPESTRPHGRKTRAAAR